MFTTWLIVYDCLLYLPRAHPTLLPGARGLVLLRVTASVLVCDFRAHVDWGFVGVRRHTEAFVCVGVALRKGGRSSWMTVVGRYSAYD